MTEQDYNAFVNFIDKLLYEIMTLEDYEIILNRLDIPIRVKTSERWGCATGCHNVNAYEGGSNLSFYTEDRTFHCFSSCSCNYNLITLVEQRFKLLGEPKKRIQCTKWICEQLNIPFEFNVEIKHENTTIYNWKANLDKYLNNGYKVEELTVYDKTIPLQITDELYTQEWIDDHISEEAQAYYGIRYYKRLSQAVIFVYDALGQCVGIRVRNFRPEATAKYDLFRQLDGTEYKLNTSLVLYGEYQNGVNCRRKKQILLAENEKCVLQCHDIYGKDDNCCHAMMGSVLSDHNLKTLVSYGAESIYILADSDFKLEDEDEYDPKEYKKFEKKMIRWYKKLKPYFTNVYVIYNNIGLKNFYKCSPTDKGSEIYWKLWDNKERLDFTEKEIKEILDED